MSYNANIQIQGKFRLATDGIVTGWCFSVDDPQQRLTVDILVNGELIMSVIAVRFNAEAFSRGLGDGHHGFSVRIPLSHLQPSLRGWVIDARERQSGITFGRQIGSSANNVYSTEARLQAIQKRLLQLKVYPNSNHKLTQTIRAAFAYAGYGISARATSAKAYTNSMHQVDAEIEVDQAPVAIVLRNCAGLAVYDLISVIAPALQGLGRRCTDLMLVGDLNCIDELKELMAMHKHLTVRSLSTTNFGAVVHEAFNYSSASTILFLNGLLGSEPQVIELYKQLKSNTSILNCKNEVGFPYMCNRLAMTRSSTNLQALISRKDWESIESYDMYELDDEDFLEQAGMRLALIGGSVLYTAQHG